VERPLQRHRCKWDDIIKMDLTEIVCEGMDWIQLVQDSGQWWALVTMVMNLQTPWS